MRFIKRIFFLIVFVVLAFFVYRLINPQAAKNLLFDIKTFSNNTLGTNFSLTGKTLIVTGTTISISGNIIQELFDDEDEHLFDSTIFTGTNSISSSTTSVISGITTGTTSFLISSSIPSTSSITSIISSTTKSITSSSLSSQSGLSFQDMRDLQKLLKNFSK